MKKSLVALAALITLTAAQAANFVQLEQENVTGRNGATNSDVTYLRAGKDLGDYSLGLQGRTAKFDNAGGIANSLEATVSNKNVSAFGITPFVGAGHDFGNTASGYNYGLVGATTGTKVGPGFAYAGLKTRVAVTAGEPHQTVGFAGYSVPVAKNVSFNVGLSRSGQDIKEKGVSAGVSFGF
jgi:hypothetical protein